MIRLTLLLVLIAPIAHAQQTLASYVGLNCVLLIFAPSDKNPLYERHLALLSRRSHDIKERELVILPVLIDEGPPITPSTLRVILGPGLPENGQLIARRQFHITGSAFTVVLLGKDGSEAFRSAAPVTMGRLDRIIDAMPMRQQQIRSPESSR